MHISWDAPYILWVVQTSWIIKQNVECNISATTVIGAVYFADHCDDVIEGALAAQITSLTIVCSTFYSGADQSKHYSSVSLAFVWGIHRGPVNSTHKWPVTRRMFPFDDVIMQKADVSYRSTIEILFNSNSLRLTGGAARQVAASTLDWKHRRQVALFTDMD